MCKINLSRRVGGKNELERKEGEVSFRVGGEDKKCVVIVMF